LVETSPELITTTNNLVTFYPSSSTANVIKYNWSFSGVKGENAGNDTSAMHNPTRYYENQGDYPVVLISTTDKG
jgi:hypothetical protein